MCPCRSVVERIWIQCASSASPACTRDGGPSSNGSSPNCLIGPPLQHDAQTLPAPQLLCSLRNAHGLVTVWLRCYIACVLFRAVPDRSLDAILASVSRSFYLSLAILPRSLRTPLCIAYLLA